VGGEEEGERLDEPRVGGEEEGERLEERPADAPTDTELVRDLSTEVMPIEIYEGVGR
jgi:hypothetical protein